MRVTRGYTHVSSLLAQNAATRLRGALLGENATKTAAKLVIIKMRALFPLVRWSRLSESNRRPIHYEGINGCKSGSRMAL